MKTEFENELWESLLKSAVIENSLKELEAYPPEKELQKINLPPHYNIVMQKFIRHYQYRKQMRAILKPTKKVASVILIIMGITFSALLTFSEVRAACETVITNIYSRYIEVLFIPNDNPDHKKLEFNYIPNGFELSAEETFDTEYTVKYVNKTGDSFTVTCLSEEYSIYMDNEHYIIQTMEINGSSGTYYKSLDKTFENILTWNNSENFFVLSSTLSETEMLKIAKNIK